MGQEEVKFNFFKFLVLKKPTTNSLLPKFTNDNYISSMYSTHRDRLNPGSFGRFNKQLL